MKAHVTIGLLALTSAVASAADTPREVRGRVVDERGAPVSGADVTTFWSANGLRWDEVKKINAEGGDWRTLHAREGRMAPWGEAPTVTDANGGFTIRVRYDALPLIAIDSERRRGGVVLNDAKDPATTVEIRLAPLVCVKGSFRAAASPGPLEWTNARVFLAEDSRSPLALRGMAMCGSLRSRFEFLLPPGRYVLEGYTDPENSQPFDTAHDRSFTVEAGRTEVDLGTVELSPARSFPVLKKEAQSRGTFGDFRTHYGRRSPRWFVTDAKGVTKDVQIEDFKGKWVLLYFWGIGCRPCLKNSMPELAAFYEAHRAQRDKFEVLGFCLDVEGELKSIADLDRVLEPVVQNVWGGRPLPFLVLLDNTFKTAENFGLSSIGDKLLIDPDGNLAEGDEKTLAEKIRE